MFLRGPDKDKHTRQHLGGAWQTGKQEKNKAICRRSWHRTTATRPCTAAAGPAEPNKGLQKASAASWEQLKPNQVQNTLFFYVKVEEKVPRVESILKGICLLVLFSFLLGGCFRDSALEKVTAMLGRPHLVSDVRKNTVTFDVFGPPLAYPPTLQLKDPLPQHIILANPLLYPCHA